MYDGPLTSQPCQTLILLKKIQFTERTPGSFIEERQASMVWRFWMAGMPGDTPDRQWAQRQAAEAQNHIFDRYVLFSVAYRCIHPL